MSNNIFNQFHHVLQLLLHTSNASRFIGLNRKYIQYTLHTKKSKKRINCSEQVRWTTIMLWFGQLKRKVRKIKLEKTLYVVSSMQYATEHIFFTQMQQYSKKVLVEAALQIQGLCKNLKWKWTANLRFWPVFHYKRRTAF